MDRRDFLKDGARAVLFGGFVLASGLLAMRNLNPEKRPLPCPIDQACQKCQRLPSCHESKAADFKQKQKNGVEHEVK